MKHTNNLDLLLLLQDSTKKNKQKNPPNKWRNPHKYCPPNTPTHSQFGDFNIDFVVSVDFSA